MTSFCHKMHHDFKTMLCNTKIFCKWLESYLFRIHASFQEKPTWNKKSYRQKIYYPKTRFDSKVTAFKKVPLLFLTNHSKVLCNILTNQIKALGSKKFPWRRVLGTTVRLNIFSNIRLTNKKFGKNIDRHMGK